MNNEPVAWRCKKFYEAQEGWFYNENEIGEPLYTHPVKELNEQFKKGFEAGKEEGWKAHKFHHPAKELHLSLQKSKQTGELLAVTYTDDEHRIVEVLWQRPPVKELTDEEIEELWYDPRFIGDPVAFGKAVLRATKNIPLQTDEEICKKCDALTERAILRKAGEK